MDVATPHPDLVLIFHITTYLYTVCLHVLLYMLLHTICIALNLFNSNNFIKLKHTFIVVIRFNVIRFNN